MAIPAWKSGAGARGPEGHNPGPAANPGVIALRCRWATYDRTIAKGDSARREGDDPHPLTWKTVRPWPPSKTRKATSFMLVQAVRALSGAVL